MTFVHLTRISTTLSFMGARPRLAGVGGGGEVAVPGGGFHMQEAGLLLGNFELNALRRRYSNKVRLLLFWRKTAFAFYL